MSWPHVDSYYRLPVERKRGKVSEEKTIQIIAVNDNYDRELIRARDINFAM